MNDSLSSLKLKEIMAEIIGRQLGSVTFVQDYIQFAFDGPELTFSVSSVVSKVAY